MERSLSGAIPARWQALLSIEDVLQETFVDAFIDIRTFEPRGEGAFEAWLTTLARRNLLDAVRMLEADKRGGEHTGVQRPADSSSMDVLLETLTGAGSTPSGHVARAEARDALQHAIQALPATHQQVVRMYDLDGLPMEQVAAALNRTRGAAFLLRLRAHRRLREILGSRSRFLSSSS